MNSHPGINARELLYIDPAGRFMLTENRHTGGPIVMLSTHGVCPVGCTFCFNENLFMDTPKRAYTVNEMRKHFHEAESVLRTSLDHIMLTFIGDPMLNGDVPELVNSFSDKEFFISSVFLKKQQTEANYKNLITCKNVSIQASLHSTCDKQRREIINPNVFTLKELSSLFCLNKLHVFNFFSWDGAERNMEKLHIIFQDHKILLKITPFREVPHSGLRSAKITENFLSYCSEYFNMDYTLYRRWNW